MTCRDCNGGGRTPTCLFDLARLEGGARLTYPIGRPCPSCAAGKNQPDSESGARGESAPTERAPNGSLNASPGTRPVERTEAGKPGTVRSASVTPRRDSGFPSNEAARSETRIKLENARRIARESVARLEAVGRRK